MLRRLLPSSRRAVLFAALCIAGSAQGGDFPAVELSIGLYRIQAELAHTQAAREQGLMYRQSMPANHGMLFKFPAAGLVCMWMKNTYLPLSVAFIDAGGKILNIEEMRPQTENNHCSANAAPFALEMNAGWFKKHGIAPGQRVSGLEGLPRAQ
ncbi:MAG: DUF192 domain-containing protein [Rhodocyclaceae bacterium]|nr:DUF192 domain-containing protein [Rhodocyclaceae bacterium]